MLHDVIKRGDKMANPWGIVDAANKAFGEDYKYLTDFLKDNPELCEIILDWIKTQAQYEEGTS